MTLQTHTLLMVTTLLACAVLATAAALAFNARQGLLEQTEFDGILIAELLARSVTFAEQTADEAEDAIGVQMVVQATLAAHLVEVAEGAGHSPAAINARLREIAANTILEEFWITDERGQAYLRNVAEVDFTFSPDPGTQPQAYEFYGLLTGDRAVVVQQTRKREIDERHFKYVGVPGVDKPRIVQVGYEARFLERLRGEIGLPHLLRELVSSGRVSLIQVVDPAMVTLAYSALPGQRPGPELSQADLDQLRQTLVQRRTQTNLDGPVFKVMAPIVDAEGQLLGATFVQLPTTHVQTAVERSALLAVLVAIGVLLAGTLASSVLSRRVTRPVARLTAAARAVEAASFDPESLALVAQRSDELGQLARVFQRMAREVQAREQRLKQQVRELRIEIDEAKKAREVAEITETEYFQQLRQKARQLRNRSGAAEA